MFAFVAPVFPLLPVYHPAGTVSSLPDLTTGLRSLLRARQRPLTTVLTLQVHRQIEMPKTVVNACIWSFSYLYAT